MKQLQEIKETQNRIILSIAEKFGDKFLSSKLFLNQHTLRLTKLGLNTLKKEYEFWLLDSPGVTAKNIIKLQRKMRYPYYIDAKIIVLFSEEDAFLAKLAGSEQWLDNK